ncbi:hypothetical protein Cflav_PD1852 [Pedosphaera parvula Ellin514]|uniref:Uncharacterized protein n=1 Tax=Pedosphaera parvula (strain Ellin514) TaxID=320771 RepID=B9XN94_PEDPL|nr:hypothetical protein Cflav_PD1852 [Pedosphaera parvula Ellin514]
MAGACLVRAGEQKNRPALQALIFLWTFSQAYGQKAFSLGWFGAARWA